MAATWRCGRKWDFGAFSAGYAAETSGAQVIWLSKRGYLPGLLSWFWFLGGSTMKTSWSRFANCYLHSLRDRMKLCWFCMVWEALCSFDGGKSVSQILYFCSAGRPAGIFAEKKGHMCREQAEKPGNLTRPWGSRVKTEALSVGTETSVKARLVAGRDWYSHNIMSCL